MNGFLLGLARGAGTGLPSGPSVAPATAPPGDRLGNWLKNALGVNAVASAGGGRPVTLA